MNLHTTLSNLVVSAPPPTVRPEFFPLPQRGPDPFFNLGRTTYYDLEREGQLRLVRLRKRGNVRGKVLVPFDDVLALLNRLNQAP